MIAIATSNYDRNQSQFSSLDHYRTLHAHAAALRLTQSAYHKMLSDEATSSDVKPESS